MDQPLTYNAMTLEERRQQALLDAQTMCDAARRMLKSKSKKCYAQIIFAANENYPNNKKTEAGGEVYIGPDNRVMMHQGEGYNTSLHATWANGYLFSGALGEDAGGGNVSFTTGEDWPNAVRRPKITKIAVPKVEEFSSPTISPIPREPATPLPTVPTQSPSLEQLVASAVAAAVGATSKKKKKKKRGGLYEPASDDDESDEDVSFTDVNDVNDVMRNLNVRSKNVSALPTDTAFKYPDAYLRPDATTNYVNNIRDLWRDVRAPTPEDVIERAALDTATTQWRSY